MRNLEWNNWVIIKANGGFMERLKPQIGICQWCLPEQDENCFILAKQMGYEGVELDFGLRNPKCDLRNPVIAERYKESADNCGMVVPSIALNFFHITKEHAESELYEILDLAIERALLLGAKILQLCSFGESAISSENDFLKTIKILQYACKTAEKHGIKIASENQLDAWDNLRLIERVASDNFGIYFDTANPALFDGRDGTQLLKELYEHVWEVHVKDYTITGNKFCKPLWQGECDFSSTIEYLRKQRYSGWLVVENSLLLGELANDLKRLREYFEI